MRIDIPPDNNDSIRLRKLNPRAAVIIGVCAIVFVIGLRKLHDRQYGKTLDYLRNAGMNAIEKEDYSKALSCLQQYVPARFSDVEARERLSWLLEEHAATTLAMQQAYRLNEDLLRGTTPMTDLRLRQARMAVRVGRYADAEAHLQILHPVLPTSSEVWYLSGATASALRKTDAAISFLEKAIACETPVPQAFQLLAKLQSPEAISGVINQDGDDSAAALMAEMLERSPTSDSYFIHAQWQLDRRQISSAIGSLWSGLQLEPTDLRLNAMLVRCLQIQASERLQDHSLTQEAIAASMAGAERYIAHVRNVVDQSPQEPAFVRYLAAALWSVGRQDEAVDELRKGIIRNPQAMDLHFASIDYLVSVEQIDLAERMLKAIPTGALATAEYEFLQGRLLMARQQWTLASSAFDRCSAHAEDRTDLTTRARICQAVCWRHMGNFTTATDSYRAIVAQNPDSGVGRLGLVTSYLESGHPELAIAELRQLVETPGVPAFLASRLIQYNLTLEPGIRNWQEVTDLIRDQKPRIEDPVQRALLQADMLMAQGRLERVVPMLEIARRKYPERPEIDRALAMLHGEQAGEFAQRLETLLSFDPANAAAHATLIRIQLRQNGYPAVVEHLQRLVDGQEYADLDQATRLRVAGEAAVQVTETERRSRFAEDREALKQFAIQCTERLVRLHPFEFPLLIQVMARTERLADAAKRIRADGTLPEELRSVAWIDLVRFSVDADTAVRLAAPAMVDAIRSDPGNSHLRVAYAEMLLAADQLELSRQTLVQVLEFEPTNVLAMSRMAWIRSVQDAADDKAVEMSNHALQFDPGNDLLRTNYSRVLLAHQRYDEALQVLTIPERINSTAAMTNEADARLESGQLVEAQELAWEVLARLPQDPLLPSDRRLLDHVLQESQQRINNPNEVSDRSASSAAELADSVAAGRAGH